MKKKQFLFAIIIPLFTMFGNSCFSQQQSIGIFDGHSDVGTNVKPGSATYIPKHSSTLYRVQDITFGAIMMNFNLHGKK